MAVMRSMERDQAGRDDRRGFLIMPSAVYKHVQQIFNLAGSSGTANDTAGFGKHA